MGVDAEAASHTHISALSGGQKEKVVMDKGRLRCEGEVVGEDVALDKAGDGPDEVFDAAGNKIDVKKQAALSDKDKKKKIKDIEKKLKEHKKKACLSDDEMWEIMDELEKLQSELEK